LRQAIDGETKLRASRSFDTQFFADLESKRARQRTLQGQVERLVEVEISGVAVWRLMGSGLAGSVLPALVLAFCLGSTATGETSTPIPRQLFALTPFNQRKFWEIDAWKTPFKPCTITLLDPQFNFGGTSCDSPILA
jgi:hypothetical protein